MSISMNRIMLIGHLGRDAEMRYTAAGLAVATFSIATSQRYTDKGGEKREQTQWHRVLLYGKGAEAIHEYLLTGRQVYVEGLMTYRRTKDRKTDAERIFAEVKADRVILLGRGREDRANAGAEVKADAVETAESDTDVAPF